MPRCSLSLEPIHRRSATWWASVGLNSLLEQRHLIWASTMCGRKRLSEPLIILKSNRTLRTSSTAFFTTKMSWRSRVVHVHVEKLMGGAPLGGVLGILVANDLLKLLGKQGYRERKVNRYRFRSNAKLRQSDS